jgi:hypothetical protein
MSHIKTPWAATLFLALLPIACSSKTSPTESNFRDAINYALSKQPLCVGTYGVHSFPITGDQDRLLDRLAEKGLVSISHPYPWQTRYDITPAGRATMMHSSHIVNLLMGPGDYYFCYGTGKVDKILNYEGPKTLLGDTVVDVSYAWKLSKPLPDWVRDPEVLKAAGNDAEGGTSHMMLVLTHNGWRATQDMDH